MSEKDETLREWTHLLSQHLGVPEDQVPIDAVLDLAAVAAHRVVRPAAPLTTFIVGFAAGLSVATGRPGSTGLPERPGAALDVPARAARDLAARFHTEDAPAGPGGSARAAGPRGGAASAEPPTTPGSPAAGEKGPGAVGRGATS